MKTDIDVSVDDDDDELAFHFWNIQMNRDKKETDKLLLWISSFQYSVKWLYTNIIFKKVEVCLMLHELLAKQC